MAELDDDDVTYYEKKVMALCDLESGLSEWEVNFVDDMANKFKTRPVHLTEKQTSKIVELHGRHC